MALAREGQARGERRIAKSAPIVFEQNERLESLHSRTAVSEQQVNVAVVVDVTEVAAHRAPAAIKTDRARLRRERAVTVVLINHERRAVVRPVPSLHRVDGLFM